MDKILGYIILYAPISYPLILLLMTLISIVSDFNTLGVWGVSEVILLIFYSFN